MNCYLCNKEPDLNVPLLRCGDYVCPPCYCKIKGSGENNCILCERRLIRGRRLNRLKKNELIKTI